ncbi:hypothetical protein AAF695_02775 [Aerococcus viridans]
MAEEQMIPLNAIETLSKVEYDYTHLTSEELIEGIAVLKVPEYIRSKGYIHDLTETLAQMSAMLIQLAFNQGLDVQQAQEWAMQLNNKVTKGQITMGDLSQGLKETVSAGLVAVVGEGAVSTINIVDDTVTSAKQSASTQPVIVQLHQDTRTLPNYDTDAKTLNFPNGFSAIFGKRRISVNSAVSFDFTPALSNSFVAGAVLNVKIGSYRVIPLSSIATAMLDDEILIAVVTNKSDLDNNLLSVNLTCPYTIDSIPSAGFNAKNNTRIEETTLTYENGKLVSIFDGTEKTTLNYSANKLVGFDSDFNGIKKQTSLTYDSNLLTSVNTEVI